MDSDLIATVHTTHGKKLNVQTGLFINNEFVKAAEGRTFETVNPTTGEVICQLQEGTAADIDIAVDAAEKAFPIWAKTSGKQRGIIMTKLVELIEANAEELADIESLDNGKPVKTALGFDVSECAQCFRYYAGWADKIHGKVIEAEGLLCYTRHEPIGVCGAIIPWNFPLLMLAWKLAPALACGNTIVLKTSEMTPLSAYKIASLIKEAGFPPGVVNIVAGYGPTAGAALASHLKVAKIAFTGSTAVGRSIMKAVASSNLKRVTLELGGKSPGIVFEDANLDNSVAWAHFGMYFNHGQCCCAGTRIYVQEGIYDEFLKKFLALTASHKVGDPFEDETYQGPQVSKLQYDRIMGYIEDGKSEGARVLLGGSRHGENGFFIEPTVFSDVNEKMKIMQEEIFGPVVAISKFTTEEEVIAKASETVYGLAASIFTEDITKAFRVANELKAGTVWVNCHNKLDYNTPFGGFKQSGMGRENGEYALENYTEVKTIKVNLDHSPPTI